MKYMKNLIVVVRCFIWACMTYSVNFERRLNTDFMVVIKDFSLWTLEYSFLS